MVTKQENQLTYRIKEDQLDCGDCLKELTAVKAQLSNLDQEKTNLEKNLTDKTVEVDKFKEELKQLQGKNEELIKNYEKALNDLNTIIDFLHYLLKNCKYL
ncbi:hypothetical protein D6D54_04190 [Spiroplasma poulsonii]|uniref:Uncharacterized protein n=1 Tax=Spiroplasma poulsonii TaxID=2138 RepID=A0A3S0SEI2_9MOLU|nr:hypothetical protein [Spiroplasma poulsonii]MBW3058702.1 hypothetical protein [Spiroplasma poulsonii]RUP77151.1 hypothetical protein D6D54_04190 [Spiroplasma poulsonii]